MAVHPPYLLIDIDGVLNPFPGPGGSVPPGFRPHRLDPNGNPDVPVWLNPAHGSWIIATRSMGIVRPRWTTSWNSEANRLIAPRLGLEPMPYVDLGTPDISTPHPTGYLWKRDPVSAWAGEAPLVWVDDDFAPPDHEWAKQRALSGIPTLLVQPDPYKGLQRSHIDAVRTWATAVMQDFHTNEGADEQPHAASPHRVSEDPQRGSGAYRP